MGWVYANSHKPLQKQYSIYTIPHYPNIQTFLLQTAPMDMLKNKLHLLKDLSYQHHNSTQSLSSFKKSIESLITHTERQIAFRAKEKSSFKTKIGVLVRQHILDFMNTAVSSLQDIYCITSDVHTQMIQRQLSIHEVIKQGDPLVKEIQCLNNFIHQTNLRYVSASSALKSQEENQRHHIQLKKFISESSPDLDKENRRSQNTPKNKYEPGSRYKMNMLLIARQGSEGFLKASHKLKQFQIMELSLVIDQCLHFVGDMKFLKDKLRSSPSSQLIEIPRADKSSKEKKEKVESLGLESKKSKEKEKIEDIDLLCDQEITVTLPISKKCMSQQLQRITQSQQEHESDPNPSPPPKICSP